VSLPSLEPALTVAAADMAPLDQMANELAQKADQSLQEAAPKTENQPEATPEEPKKSEADLLAEFEKMING
jgi:hypothetical protein